jgi:hypothetical protein
MKALKYILFASVLVAGLASCEKKEEAPKTQAEIEATWPKTISTAEAGKFVLVERDLNGFTMGDATLATSSPEHIVDACGSLDIAFTAKDYEDLLSI